MFDFPMLETSSLLLREITEADAPRLFQIHSNAEHMKWFGYDPVADLKGALAMVNFCPTGGSNPALEPAGALN